MNCCDRNSEQDCEMSWWGWALLIASLVAAWALAVTALLRRRDRQTARQPRLSLPDRRRVPAAAIELDEARGPVFGREKPEAARQEPDDLKRVEGIGPKIEAALHEAGLTTFCQIAEMDAEGLLQTVKQAGIRLAFPATWPEQAALAAAGRWAELEELQGQLKGGRRI